MPSTRFNVGDRVVVNSGRYSDLNGMTATVRALRSGNNGEVGLQFDERPARGHDLSGNVPNGYGWWVFGDDISLIDSSIPRRQTIEERLPIGTRVRYIGHYAPIRNYEGTVLCHRDSRSIGIYFDNSCSDFNNLDGQCENRHGYYFSETDVEPLGIMVKIKTRICSCCKQRKTTASMTKGTNGKYTCFQCVRVQNYSTRNDVRVHSDKNHKKTYGFEFEVIPNSREDVAAIMSYGWGLIPTSDGSLPSNGIEFKTPTYSSLNGLKPLLRTMSKHADFRHESCGQHINIGDTEYLNAENMRRIRLASNDIFTPLYQHMSNNATTTKDVCGRTFNRYAKLTNYSDHFSWINLGHDNRIEFRVSKYKNANQYFQLACMWSEMLDCVITHFIKKCVEVPTFDIPSCCDVHRRAGLANLSAENRDRYNQAIATNKAATEKTAQYLIKIFDKYAQGKATCQRPERNSYTSEGTKRTTAA